MIFAGGLLLGEASDAAGVMEEGMKVLSIILEMSSVTKEAGASISHHRGYKHRERERALSCYPQGR